jgi:hypothetical protein
VVSLRKSTEFLRIHVLGIAGIRTRLILLPCSLVALGPPCAAQESSSGFYFAPLVQRVLLDEQRGSSDDAAFTFAAGFEATRRWNFELDLFRGRFDGPGAMT